MRVCHWCGARESGLGIHSDPDAYPKFSCEIIHLEFGRVCPKRRKIGPLTLAQYQASQHRSSMVRYLSLMALEALSANLFLGSRLNDEFMPVFESTGEKVGDTIQFRKPPMYRL